MARQPKHSKRISLTAKLGKTIHSILVERTLLDHERKCVADSNWAEGDVCEHMERRTYQCAKVLEEIMTITAKRTYIDVPCPFLTFEDGRVAADFVETLKVLGKRVKGCVSTVNTQRSRYALSEAGDEIIAYASRNAMEVLAEASL